MGAEILYVDREPFGHEVLVALPDGAVIDLDLGRDGTWLEATASDGSTFAPTVLNGLLPAAVLQNPVFEGLNRVTEVERYPWGFEIYGFDASGFEMELEFTPDGERR